MNTETQAERADKESEAKRRSALVRSSKGLMPYGTPEELAEMVGRFRFMIPGGDKLSDHELWALSQVSFAHGLNPIIGECFWADGFLPGIRGLRRKGRDQLVEIFESGGLPNLDFVLVTDIQELAKNKIPEGALTYKCVGMVPAKRKAYAEDARVLSEAGAPWDRIEALIGEIPKTVGYGYLTEEQMFNKDHPEWWHICTNEDKNTEKRKLWIDGKQKWVTCFVLRDRKCPECDEESWKEPSNYSHVQHAQKRAEAHFWKLECDLPFEISPSGEGMADQGGFDDIEIIDTTAIEVDAIAPTFMGHEVPENIKTTAEFEDWVAAVVQDNLSQQDEEFMTEEEKEAEGAKASEQLYGDEGVDRSSPSYWPMEILQALIGEKCAMNEFQAAGMLSYSAFDKNVAKGTALIYGKHYRAARDEDKESKEAGEIGMAAYLSTLKGKKS